MKKKVIIILSISFMVFMTGLFIYFLVKDDTSKWQVGLGGIIVSGLPLLLLFLRNNPFNIPEIIGYYVFIFCSTFLGSIVKFYVYVRWWDTTLHLYKGLFMGVIAITLIKVLITKEALERTSRFLIFLFVLSLAIVASVVWEIYEFFGDLYYTETMQRGGNKDTMYDLLAGFAGALIIASYAGFRKQKF
ncbi:membrane-spanning protein [Peribacillus deserti]|uniref:Membrane-spanning protein n=1 Tax=Peribacillus deserti TaxID=673318 RepID=A0A2N5M855_9BACI|nr:membrane-spanning protein [Peribacillus deserti]PLT30515.1 membrane-spanning protein [Peribacillus deserti]